MPSLEPATVITRRHAVAGVSLLLAGAAYASRVTHVSADEDKSNPLYDTTITPLASGSPKLVPGYSLLLLRMTVEAGVEIPAHTHPGPVALYVEQGSFGTAFVEGSGTVTQAGTEATPTAAITLNAGDDTTMEVGDHLFYDGATHTMRNDGSDQVILLISALFDDSKPGFMFMNMATPAS